MANPRRVPGPLSRDASRQLGPGDLPEVQLIFNQQGSDPLEKTDALDEATE